MSNQPNESLLIPASGVFKNGIHEIAFRVYYENTDMGGVVFYAEYLRWLERARTEMLRQSNLNQIELYQEGLLFVVAELTIKYHKPALMDDVIVVKTQLLEKKNTFFVCEQTIFRGSEKLLSAQVKVCSINKLGKPCRMPLFNFHCTEKLKH
ncbi:MAG: acyl-CoA thioesterase [Rickettsiales bacterium]|nr:acyl-CoA thioesterase [Rickettsiales bacterium]|tara:strand:- start:38387 stop:38842 length:456 start_codon:yes stop_codon:yes gene_type:complete